MARPLRIEYPGALYHVTSRGNAQANIYFDDADRRDFLRLLSKACEEFHWSCHAYCLMDNHYHLLIETNKPTLAKGMRFLNGVYTQRINKKYDRVGHLLQGRYKAILVQSDAYLLELARYIVLNPVRANIVKSAAEWRWSSYLATAGLTLTIEYPTSNLILQQFSRNRSIAARRYREFVSQGVCQPSPWSELTNQIYLGDTEFVKSALARVRPSAASIEIPKPQKLAAPRPLTHYQSTSRTRNEALAAAYLSGHYSLEKIGRFFGVSRATVARAVRQQRDDVKCPT